jgi:CRISPR-associated protein Csb1
VSVQKGDAEPLAKIAPTSLVFGAWDSRDTQAKLPRLIVSTIRAFNVAKLTRSAQFTPATDYVKNGFLDEPTDKGMKDLYSQRGFVHVPATGTPGGVIAKGGIRRDAAMHLAALRLLRSRDDESTLRLRRYVLGIALVAFTQPGVGYLRQGCSLVLDPDKKRTQVAVNPDGQRVEVALTHEQALTYARESAAAFGVGASKEVPFDKELAKKDLAGDEGPSKPAKANKKK